MKHDNSNQNPWAGLSSYEDPAKSEQKLKFCGRDSETKEVARLIDDNFFVTLYGKSGIGKTSLLNAGVFPALRREQYTPLSLRLGMTEAAISFQDVITQAIERAIDETGGRVHIVNVMDEQAEQDATDYLWRWFARRRFLTADGQITFPVLIFDQFEEVFRQADSRRKTEVLLNQLNYLIDESHAISDAIVEGEAYSYDFNFRFVLSIREDDLYRLEDSLDNCSLPALKRCRYRLRSLTEQGARDAILIPGKGLFKEEEENAIVNTIIAKSHNEDGSISTNIISLLCSRIFVDYQRTDTGHISTALVDRFIKGNPFERFYNEATRGFSNKEKSFIEDHLVDSTGRRNSIPESDFLLHVPKGKQLLEGDTRILQRTSTSSDGGNYRVELIHDSFCEPLAGMKEKREKRRRLMWLALAAAIVLLCGGITAYIVSMASKNLRLEGTNQELVDSLTRTLAVVERERDAAQIANLQKDSANAMLAFSNAQLDSSFQQLSEREQQLSIANQGYQTNLSRVLAEKASKLVDEGDSYLARIIALQALPPNRPYTIEAESAIRKAMSKETSILYGHQSWVKSASFSPCGNHIVTASHDGTTRIWNVKTGLQENIFGTLSKTVSAMNFIRYASYSPDGNKIALLPYYGFRIIDTKSEIIIAKMGKGHSKRLESVEFSPDGKYIVTSSMDSIVSIWDSNTGEEIDYLRGHSDYVLSAVYSPNGKYIASSSWDGTIRIWDSNTHKVINVLKEHTGSVNSVSFSHDSKYIVSASSDKTIKIWTPTGKRSLLTLDGHTAAVNSAKFSSDGNYFIVSGADDKTIRVWDVSNMNKRNSNQLFVLYGHVDAIKSVSFSPDNKKIVSASCDGTVRIWDSGIWERGYILYRHNSFANSIALSPDETYIASASYDHNICLWDLQNRTLSVLPPYHNKNINAISFSPDGKKMVSASADKTIIIWDIDKKDSIRVLRDGHWLEIHNASFSPDGKKVVSSSMDNNVIVWDLLHNKYKKIAKHGDEVFYARFSPDGKYIATASEDRTIKYVNAQNGNTIKTFSGHIDDVNSVEFSHDGHYLVSASSDKTIRIWDISNNKEIHKFEGHKAKVTQAIFCYCGKHIISSSADQTVKVWDLDSGKEVCTFQGHHSNVNSVAITKDCKRIYSCSSDGTIREWYFPTLQELIKDTSERFKNRQLTPEERRKYYLE